MLYQYRGKGGKQGKRELPQPAFDAIKAALTAWGKSLDTMAQDESLWPSPSGKGPARQHLLHELEALPKGCWAAAFGRARAPPLSRQAPARRRREHRGRLPVPRSQLAGGDDDLPAAPRGRGGSRLGQCRCRHRACAVTCFIHAVYQLATSCHQSTRFLNRSSRPARKSPTMISASARNGKSAHENRLRISSDR